jgi:GLPGLI family protein
MKTLIILFFSTLLYSQTHNNYTNVIYKAKYATENYQVGAATANAAQINEIEKMYIESYPKLEYKLIFDNEQSIFTTIDKMEFAKDMYCKLAQTSINTNSAFYINFKTKQKINQFDFQGHKSNINVSREKFDWVITRESSIIQGLKSYKATTQKTNPAGFGEPATTMGVEAWFTPEIPTSTGPVGFEGLPGLILSVSYNNIIVYASKIEKNISAEIKPPFAMKTFDSEEAFTKDFEKIFDEIKNKSK